MRQETKQIDWKKVEDGQVTQWYFVSKIMSFLIPRTFPYFTFACIVDEIRQDPNYNHKKEEE